MDKAEQEWKRVFGDGVKGYLGSGFYTLSDEKVALCRYWYIRGFQDATRKRNEKGQFQKEEA